MRINKYLAQATGLSRRAADSLIEAGRVAINDQRPQAGQQVTEGDMVSLDGKALSLSQPPLTIMLNKPTGYVCSRNGQGSRTIYDLLPTDYHHLKPVGRLDKDSSGLLLLTNDGQLANQLTHPKYQKTKIYKIAVSPALEPLHRQMISDPGITLDDGPSRLQLERLNESDDSNWKVIMSEGRNRQIRRTFAALGYSVVKLHRTQLGSYQLGSLKVGQYEKLT